MQAKLIQKEGRETGAVKWSVIRGYISKMVHHSEFSATLLMPCQGGMRMFQTIAFMMLLSEFCRLGGGSAPGPLLSSRGGSELLGEPLVRRQAGRELSVLHRYLQRMVLFSGGLPSA